MMTAPGNGSDLELNWQSSIEWGASTWVEVTPEQLQEILKSVEEIIGRRPVRETF